MTGSRKCFGSGAVDLIRVNLQQRKLCTRAIVELLVAIQALYLSCRTSLRAIGMEMFGTHLVITTTGPREFNRVHAWRHWKALAGA